MASSKAKKSIFNRFLDMVEKVGNKLPHPVTIFVILSLVVMVVSHLAAAAGVTVSYETLDKATGAFKTVDVKAVSLLVPAGLKKVVSSIVTNFTGFAPLGTVLVAMLGVGVAESTGFISAVLRKLVLSAPKRLITAAVVFAGIMSNVASDAGYVVLVPLGAVVFLSFKRHPIAGLAAAFAGVSGGFSANLLIGTIDPLLSGITSSAMTLVDPGFKPLSPMVNYYFMFVSTFILTAIGTYVTEKIVEPRLGEYKGQSFSLDRLNSEERKGLLYAGLSLLALIVVLLFLTIPQGALLRDANGSLTSHDAPFMAGLVPIIALLFMVPGIVYGAVVGVVKNDKDIAHFMGKAMSSMGGYLVLAFAAAQFVQYFAWSNLGTILAVSGANFLKSTGFTGIPLILTFILVSAFINLFIGSASAKWAIMAPIFVPMFFMLGFSPEFTQIAYRIGDSSTNIISPLMSYFAVIVSFAEKYDEEAGIGTLISTMLPYSIMFLLFWSILLIIWMVFKLPIGPGATIFASLM